MATPSKVGDTFVYPHSQEWRRKGKITEEDALERMFNVVPDALIAGYTNVTAASIRNRENTYRWLNKLAVVVEVDGGKMLALYKHDSDCWVIEKRPQ